jgi:2,3-bisphosphoglycerate-independent phosphoglycerate mutase
MEEMNGSKAHVLLVFVDGLGLGCDDPGRNPIQAGAFPALHALLREHAVPVDVRMGVEGCPQSATGQTALLTGINAAQAVGRHVEGFPGSRLREIICEHNIFLRMSRCGLKSTFANAYYSGTSDEVRARRIQSVTTVATLCAFGKVRERQAMERNEAVYQDLTREGLRAQGYGGPFVAPAESARHLLAIAREHHLTLFEYFQTDRAGHKRDPEHVRRALGLLDEFLSELLNRKPSQLDLVLTSDHGNIEDLTQSGHTLNQVPFAAVGPHAARLKAAVRAITDITPALLSLWE